MIFYFIIILVTFKLRPGDSLNIQKTKTKFKFKKKTKQNKCTYKFRDVVELDGFFLF